MAKKAKKPRKAKRAAPTTTATPDVTMPRRYRDAQTGRFVTKKYAKRNRKTTTKEALAS